MKLFLSSMAISYSQGRHFVELVGKPNPQDIKIALIENAADPYEEGKKEWVYQNRDSFTAHGFKVDLVDLEEYRKGRKLLLPRLKEADAIWLGGGNTYYLRWILRETKADTIIKNLVRTGKVYGGGSAGAIMAGPTIDFFQIADNPKDAPEEILDGLGLTYIVPIPHWNNDKYGKVMQEIEKSLHIAGYETMHITDEQALVIDGTTHKVV